jgi:hypothetical protein
VWGWLLVAAVLGTPGEGRAATIAYRTDAQLVELSDRVVHGRVLDVRFEASPERRRIYTITRLAVLEDFTGGTDPVVEIRELGGAVDGLVMRVPGVPVFVPGQEVVVCLRRIASGLGAGQYRSVALEFSTFAIGRDATGAVALIRDAVESEIVGAPAPAITTRSRTLSDFRSLVATVKGAAAVRPGGERFIEEADRARAAAEASGQRATAAFTLLSDMRWREADTNTPVTYYRNTSAPAPVFGSNGDPQMVTALQAWTDPSPASLTLVFGGAQSPINLDEGCPSQAGKGLITYEDPYDEIFAPTIAIGGGCSGGSHFHNTKRYDTITNGFVLFNNASDLSSDIKQPTNFMRVLAHEIGHTIGLGHTCDNGLTIACTAAMRVNLMYQSCCSNETPVPPAIGPDDRAGLDFIYASDTPAPPADTDNDGLTDAWETNFGLDPNSAAGDNGPGGNPDLDGFTNLQEFQNGTHPRGFEQRYFAEGVVNSFFETEFSLLNPGSTKAIALLRLQLPDGTEKSYRVEVPAQGQAAVTSAALGNLVAVPFATLIESDLPIVADRTVTGGAGGYGSHTETAVLSPSATWFLAEGATGGAFELFYLIQNSNSDAVTVRVTYLLPFGLPPLVKDYGVPGKGRLTIAVDNETFPSRPNQFPLSGTDVSAKIEVVSNISPTPGVIVERAMYYSLPGQVFAAGHESAAVPAPRNAWFFAEGATGSFFDTFILLANPGLTPATVNATYLLTSGNTVTETYTLGPQSRSTVWLNEEEIPKGSGIKPLRAVDVSTTLASTQPIIAERAMWWPRGRWYEAHNSAGATRFGTRWAIADGEIAGPRGAQTFLLVANVSDQPARVKVTLLNEGGGPTKTWPGTGGQTIPAHSRFTIPIDTAHFSLDTSALRRFGAIVDSLDGQAIVVERANYYTVGGVVWAAGGGALAACLICVQ